VTLSSGPIPAAVIDETAHVVASSNVHQAVEFIDLQTGRQRGDNGFPAAVLLGEQPADENPTKKQRTHICTVSGCFY
jgi:hypothetical protein